jgi:aromatic-L-amino-acid decarboxylase
MQDRLRNHIALAQELASWIEAEPGWHVVAPHPLSVVCFRYAGAERENGSSRDARELDALNQSILDAVNATGEAFLSSTRLHGDLVLRVAIGNERTTRDDVAHVWSLLRREAAAVARPAESAES